MRLLHGLYNADAATSSLGQDGGEEKRGRQESGSIYECIRKALSQTSLASPYEPHNMVAEAAAGARVPGTPNPATRARLPGPRLAAAGEGPLGAGAAAFSLSSLAVSGQREATHGRGIAVHKPEPVISSFTTPSLTVFSFSSSSFTFPLFRRSLDVVRLEAHWHA